MSNWTGHTPRRGFGCPMPASKPGPNRNPRKRKEIAEFKFGKHAGRTFEEVYKEDPDYLVWMRDNAHFPPLKRDLAMFLHRKNAR
jgi:broad specificity phosphatase PhoE